MTVRERWVSDVRYRDGESAVKAIVGAVYDRAFPSFDKL